MANRRPQKNALKHGVFSKATLLPGEDLREFEELRKNVFAEWLPIGVTEEDAAQDIARALWLKVRYEAYKRKSAPQAGILDARRKHIAKLIEEEPEPLYENTLAAVKDRISDFHRTAPDERAEDDVSALLGFTNSLFGLSIKSDVEFGIDHLLPASYAKHLEKNVPDNKFSSTREWIVALKKEVGDVLLPRARKALKDLLDNSIPENPSPDQSPELILKDLEMSDRINMMIEKCIRRLMHVKTFKQISVQRHSVQKQIGN